MAEKIKAIVIKSSDRKEKDKNILLFSIEYGKIWATLKGVKSPNAKMKLAQNPFCFGEFILEDGKLGKIVTGLEVIETFHELSEDVDKYFESSGVLEVVNKMIFSNEKEQMEVFLLMIKTLKSICFCEVKPLYCLDKFMIELLKICGASVFSEKCSNCGDKLSETVYINYNVGELVCSNCKDSSCVELSKAIYLALKIVNNTDFERLGTVKLVQDSEKALLRVLVKNFEMRFDSHLKLIGILS